MLLATIQGQWTPFDFAWTFMGVAAVGGKRIAFVDGTLTGNAILFER